MLFRLQRAFGFSVNRVVVKMNQGRIRPSLLLFQLAVVPITPINAPLLRI